MTYLRARLRRRRKARAEQACIDLRAIDRTRVVNDDAEAPDAIESAR